MARQSQQIEKLEADLSMINQSVLGLAKNSRTWTAQPKFSIGSARVVVEKEETARPIYEDKGKRKHSPGAFSLGRYKARSP